MENNTKSLSNKIIIGGLVLISIFFAIMPA